MNVAPALPSGPRRPKLLMNLQWIGRPIQLLEDAARRYGDPFTLRFAFNEPMVVFSDPAAVRDIFTADPEVLRAGEGNEMLRPIVGDNSLLLLDGARHLRERKILMPPFHGERMRAYGQAMREIAARRIATWTDGRRFPLHAEMQAITLDVILKTVFGLTDEGRLARARHLLSRYGNLGSSRLSTSLLMLVPTRLLRPLILLGVDPVSLGPLRLDLTTVVPWRDIARAGREVEELLREEFTRRRKEGAGGEDVLSLLLAARHEDGSAMSDQELQDELLTLLIAGHETSATTLAWTVHHLLRHPSILAEARAEVERVTAGGATTADRVQDLELLDAILKESLRLTPILPFVARRVAAPTTIGGRALPAGTVALACIWLAHRDPKAWPDPERFDPSRFLGRKLDPYEWFPFGGGSRRCLGMAFALYEMKIVLAELVRRVDLEAAGPVRMVRRGITFAPSGGLRVTSRVRPGS